MKRTLTKYASGLFLLSLLIFTSCAKDADGLDRDERRLVGAWHYEKAYVQTGIFSTENRLNDYLGDKITLNKDFTATHYHDDTQVESIGTWELTERQVGDCWTDVLTLNLTRSTNSETHEIEFGHVDVCLGQFSGSTDTNTGEIEFEFCRE